MKKIKVLIIPSWFPNKKDPLWGNYFVNQALELSEYCDASLLYINRVGLREIFNIFREKKTDGYDELKYKFKFYKKSIINFKYLNLDYSFRKYAKNAYKAYKKLTKYTGKPDVIFVQSSLPAGIAAKYIKEKENIPYVVHTHSLSIFNNPYYKNYVIDVIKNASFCMSVNEDIKNEIENITKNECNIVPNFIDCKKFDVKLNNNNDKFVLINISNFYKVKALDVLLKALYIVVNKKNYKNVYLKIVGTGEYKSYYESIAKSLNLNDNVEFLGYVSNSSIPKLLSESNVLCVSSTYETFCIPIVEAFAAGLPVITTNCRGPLEIVNNKNSIITPINDIEKYAESIIFMVNNYDKYSHNEIKKYAFNKYDKSVNCKNIIDILEKAKKSS